MTVDALRSRILLLWISATVFAYVLLVYGATAHVNSLSFMNIGASSRDLSSVVAPTLLMLLGHYFVERQASVEPTRGQYIIVITLSVLYLLAVVAITAAMIFVREVEINQAGVNNYAWLSPWQPIVVGPTFYIFGVSKRRR